MWQTDLNAVGCWAGAVDGALGPQTEAAIREFQAAKGLTVDGLLGPQTEGALQDAVAAGEIVCEESSSGDEGSGGTKSDNGGSGDSDGSASGPSASLEGSLVSQVFTVTSCANEGETDLVLEAEVDVFMLSLEAPEGKGTISYTGGDEQDGIDLSGTVSSVTVGDAGNFTVEGSWDSGEAFTLTGSCAA